MKKYFQGKKLQTASSLPSYSNSSPALISTPSSPSTNPSPGRRENGKSGLKLSPQRSAGTMIVRLVSPTSSSTKSKRSEKSSAAGRPRDRCYSQQLCNMESNLVSVFEVFDADGDGKISATELGLVLRSLGDDLTEQDLQSIVEHADADGDGFISLEEFIAFNKTSADSPTIDGPEDRRTTDDEECMKVAFRTFDKDGNGFISANELHSVLLGLGDEAHSLEDCHRMISSFDKDGDGFVDYQEFRSLLGVC